MEFIWNDGGRSASGFVGLASDCVARAIAIATGAVYRDVYDALGEAAHSTARNGVPLEVSHQYLHARRWRRIKGQGCPFDERALPKGIVVAHVAQPNGRKSHLTAVIHHVVHDTWNPSEDEDYVVTDYWVPLDVSDQPALSTVGAAGARSSTQQLTQNEFEKILRRLRALDNTASNDASTEGEKHNALRMMHDLMLRHNLTREDIVEESNVEGVRFARIACPLNGRRGTTWEHELANYVTTYIFSTVQYYTGTRGHRTFIWFYGPLDDVQNCLALYRELLLTIAASARLRYGGYVRGSGASYAEGYVWGLPRSVGDYARTTGGDTSSFADTCQTTVDQAARNSGSLVQMRTLALAQAARQWLELECHVKLTTRWSRGRDLRDPAATSLGKSHGASHKLDVPGGRKRLT